MPAIDARVAELGEDLAALLRTLTPTSDALLVRSAGLLAGRGGWPSWLLLRRVSVGCHCRISTSGGVRILIVNLPGSLRDLLVADVTIAVQPVPPETPDHRPGTTVRSCTLPAGVHLRPTADERARLLPWGVDPARSLLLRTGPESWYGFGVSGELGPTHIAARWTLGGTAIDLPAGEGVPWIAAPFFDLAFALTRSSAAGAGAGAAFSLHAASPLWELIESLLEAGERIAVALDEGWAVSPPEGLRPEWQELRTRWGLNTIEARVTPLLAPDGSLATANVDDTFAAPFTLALATVGRRQAEVRLALPDFVVSGGMRQAILDACGGVGEYGGRAYRDAYGGLEDAADEAGVPPAVARGWLAGEAAVLRVDRRPRRDEVVILVAGEYEGQRVGLFVWLWEVRWGTDERLEAIEGIEAVAGGPLARLSLGYKAGKQAWCDFLHGLLRWRAAVAP